jgi:G3E family GTPase
VAVPVHIISGFLGAGKTTAIRAQLEARRGERVAVIVNDFGEASLDEAVLAEGEPFRITNIPGACVCCTAPEGFVDALGAVLAERPERLLIEPTGLARPQDLVDTIRRSRHAAGLVLAPVVVMLDPRRLADAAGAGRELRAQQVEAADVLVANRTDLCGPEDLERFDAWVRTLWPEPIAVHRTQHGRIPVSLLEWPEGEGERLPRAAGGAAREAHEHSTAGFAARSWRWAPDLVFSSERLRGALGPLATGQGAARLERFKGIFRTREGVLRYEVAGGELHEAPSAHRRDSRADAILCGPDAAPLEELAGRLAAAMLTARELEARAGEIELALPDGRRHVVDRAQLAALPDGVADVSQILPKRAGSAARIASVLASLGIEPRGEAVVVAADGFASEPVALPVLAQGLLLHGLAGGALPREQGGPFRLLMPPDVAGAPSSCANVKAVVRIVLRESADSPGG